MSFIAAIFESHAGNRTDLPVAVQLALIARFYERIGDHAVNIGEWVGYAVTGDVPGHRNGPAQGGAEENAELSDTDGGA